MNQNARAKLISAMEEIIAKECYTKGLQNNKKYRYPVNFKINGSLYKGTHGRILVDTHDISTMYYQFGVHRMDIGIALNKILDLIEHNIVFEESSFKEPNHAYYNPNGAYYEDDDADKWRIW